MVNKSLIINLFSFENSNLEPNTLGVLGWIFLRNLLNSIHSSIFVSQDTETPNNLKSIELIKSKINLSQKELSIKEAEILINKFNENNNCFFPGNFYFN